MTVHVKYATVSPIAYKQPVKQYLNAVLTLMFKRDTPYSAFASDYIDFIQILTN